VINPTKQTKKGEKRELALVDEVVGSREEKPRFRVGGSLERRCGRAGLHRKKERDQGGDYFYSLGGKKPR